MSVAVLSWALDRLDRGERVAIASVIESSGSVPGKPGAKMAISSKDCKFGTVGGAGLELKVEVALRNLLNDGSVHNRKSGGRVETFLLHKDGRGDDVSTLDSLCGGRVTIAMEVLEPMPHILIAGGGHVGRCVAIVCDTLGWSHSVLDSRGEYSSRDRFPFASELFSMSVDEFFELEDSESICRFTDVIILGHDWKVDESLLLGLLDFYTDGNGPRIGVIGSKTKWSSFKSSATKSGVDEGRLMAVRCPIGLEIGADTPEEIALAICAEILSLERM